MRQIDVIILFFADVDFYLKKNICLCYNYNLIIIFAIELLMLAKKQFCIVTF